MGRAKVVLVLLFLLTLGAGLVMGLLLARPPANTVRASSQTSLGAELGLTPAQSGQLRGIWEGVRDKVDACFGRAQELQKQRDEVLLTLLTDSQKARYAVAQQEYAGALARLKSERDALFQTAVKESERVMSETQRQRYRQILASRLGQEAGAAAPDWIAPAGLTTRLTTWPSSPVQPTRR